MASLVFRSIFGTQQASFASSLMPYTQLRGSEWTTSTVICKGNLEGVDLELGKTSAIVMAKLQRLLDEFDRRMQEHGYASLGFATREAADTFRHGLERFMRLHGDTGDWLRKTKAGFWDGIAAIIKRSSQTKHGASDVFAGALQLLGALQLKAGSSAGAAAESGKSQGGGVTPTPTVMLEALQTPVAERRRAVASLKAPKEGSLDYARTHTQIHGASGADGRDVNILFKGGQAAELPHRLQQDLPALALLADHSEHGHKLAVWLLKRYVLVHSALEVPDLRGRGMWKKATSKHSGEKVYRFRDAQWDAARFADAEAPERAAELSALKEAAEKERPKGPAAMMAAAAEVMILRVGPQTILRPFALKLMALSAASASPLTRASFVDAGGTPLISEYAFNKRLGHAFTTLDGKISHWHRFTRALAALRKSKEETLKRALMYGHGHYWVGSGYRERLSQDDGGELTDTWLHGTALEQRALVRDVAVANAEEMLADKTVQSIVMGRHGISGLPPVTKPPNPETQRGGKGPSLVGYADLSNEQYSLMNAIDCGSLKLMKANELRGAGGVVAQLAESSMPGGGGIMSQRTVTLLEASNLLARILEPYLTGGNGTKKAKMFTGAVLGLSEAEVKAVSVHELLRLLKARLEVQDKNGDRKFGARLRACAASCQALAGLEDFMARVGNTLLTGGMLECVRAE